jgi:radical SAM-linked protein
MTMRLRITFSKTGSLRYIGHLDLHTVWERTIRRAGLPLMYTQGFHPGPRIQLASALPLGFIGRCEIVDIWVEGDPTTEVITTYASVIQPAAPPGLTILSVEPVDDHSPALQTQVASAEYEVCFLDPLTPEQAASLPYRITGLLAASTLPGERRGKPYDLRPLIESLSIVGAVREPPNPVISMRLAAREGATGRPEAVLEALGIPFESTRIERTRILLKDT